MQVTGSTILFSSVHNHVDVAPRLNPNPRGGVANQVRSRGQPEKRQGARPRADEGEGGSKMKPPVANFCIGSGAAALPATGRVACAEI